MSSCEWSKEKKRKVLERFYQEYAPEKLAKLEGVLKHFESRFQDLLLIVKDKYNVEITDDGEFIELGAGSISSKSSGGSSEKKKKKKKKHNESTVSADAPSQDVHKELKKASKASSKKKKSKNDDTSSRSEEELRKHFCLVEDPEEDFLSELKGRVKLHGTLREGKDHIAQGMGIADRRANFGGTRLPGSGVGTPVSLVVPLPGFEVIETDPGTTQVDGKSLAEIAGSAVSPLMDPDGKFVTHRPSSGGLVVEEDARSQTSATARTSTYRSRRKERKAPPLPSRPANVSEILEDLLEDDGGHSVRSNRGGAQDTSGAGLSDHEDTLSDGASVVSMFSRRSTQSGRHIKYPDEESVGSLFSTRSHHSRRSRADRHQSKPSIGRRPSLSAYLDLVEEDASLAAASVHTARPTAGNESQELAGNTHGKGDDSRRRRHRTKEGHERIRTEHEREVTEYGDGSSPSNKTEVERTAKARRSEPRNRRRRDFPESSAGMTRNSSADSLVSRESLGVSSKSSGRVSSLGVSSKSSGRVSSPSSSKRSSVDVSRPGSAPLRKELVHGERRAERHSRKPTGGSALPPKVFKVEGFHFPPDPDKEPPAVPKLRPRIADINLEDSDGDVASEISLPSRNERVQVKLKKAPPSAARVHKGVSREPNWNPKNSLLARRPAGASGPLVLDNDVVSSGRSESLSSTDSIVVRQARPWNPTSLEAEGEENEKFWESPVEKDVLEENDWEWSLPLNKSKKVEVARALNPVTVMPVAPVTPPIEPIHHVKTGKSERTKVTPRGTANLDKLKLQRKKDRDAGSVPITEENTLDNESSQELTSDSDMSDRGDHTEIEISCSEPESEFEDDDSVLSSSIESLKSSSQKKSRKKKGKKSTSNEVTDEKPYSKYLKYATFLGVAILLTVWPQAFALFTSFILPALLGSGLNPDTATMWERIKSFRSWKLYFGLMVLFMILEQVPGLVPEEDKLMDIVLASVRLGSLYIVGNLCKGWALLEFHGEGETENTLKSSGKKLDSKKSSKKSKKARKQDEKTKKKDSKKSESKKKDSKKKKKKKHSKKSESD